MSGIVRYTDSEKVNLVTFPVLFGSQIASLSIANHHTTRVGEGSSLLVSLALARRFFPIFLFRVCVPKGVTVPGVFSEDRGT